MIVQRRHASAPTRVKPAHLRGSSLIVALAIVALALVLAGCIRIQRIEAPSGVEAGPDYEIVGYVHPATDVNDARASLAFRHPAGWEVTEVTYSGDQSGSFTHSAAISRWFAVTWEDKPEDATHNGPKTGYAWWAGYTPPETVRATDDVRVIIHIDTHGIGGDYLLDFVTGFADTEHPTDPEINEYNWVFGGAGLFDAEGVALDQAVTLVDGTYPDVLDTDPASGEEEVAVDVEPRVLFTEQMDPATIDGTTLYLVPAGAGGTRLPARVSYSASTMQAVIDLDEPLAYDTDYLLVVESDVADLVGYTMTADHVVPFATQEDEEEPTPAFADVPPSHRYHEAITGLAAAGIVAGYEVSPGVFEFRPEAEVWRAQFAKMIVGSLVIPVAEGDPLPPFTDLGPDDPDDLYPHEFVGGAYRNGITAGTTPATFAPYDDISRAQVVTMVVRAVQYLGPGSLALPPADYTNTWGTGFSPIHGENARIAEYNGLLTLLPLNTTASDPWAPMPRGEVAQVLWNMIGLLD